MKMDRSCKKIKDINKDKPTIAHKGERLMVLCKTNEDLKKFNDGLTHTH